MYWAVPPVHGGKPMPMIEPMLASAVDVSTPSSRHFWVSSASANSIRSIMSCSGGCDVPERNVSRRPGHSPDPLTVGVFVETLAAQLAWPAELDHLVDDTLGGVRLVVAAVRPRHALRVAVAILAISSMLSSSDSCSGGAG